MAPIEALGPPAASLLIEYLNDRVPGKKMHAAAHGLFIIYSRAQGEYARSYTRRRKDVVPPVFDHAAVLKIALSFEALEDRYIRWTVAMLLGAMALQIHDEQAPHRLAAEARLRELCTDRDENVGSQARRSVDYLEKLRESRARAAENMRREAEKQDGFKRSDRSRNDEYNLRPSVKTENKARGEKTPE